ncbi:signal peptidase I [Candidatus Peregrinibacteria bacterium]|nr:signal peptidase I [Candidatus Peregrinibacteria bacterium]
MAKDKKSRKILSALLSTIKFIGEIVIDALILFGVFYLLKAYVIAPFEIYGPSMCNNFNYIGGECRSGYGEYIIINKIGYKNIFGWQIGLPQRGDVVIFNPPHEKEFYIKRVVGLPGETVIIKEGEIYIKNDQNPEGKKLEEPYLNKASKGNTTTFGLGRTEFKIPEGKYFLAGDNRPQSTDGRTCFKDVMAGGCKDPENAFVPLSDIAGRGWVVLWPYEKISWIPRQDY